MAPKLRKYVWRIKISSHPPIWLLDVMRCIVVGIYRKVEVCRNRCVMQSVTSITP